MTDDVRREQLHEVVEQRLSRFIRADNVPPQSVKTLCGDLIAASQIQRWFLATCACALLGELFIGSHDGGTLLTAAEARREKKQRKRNRIQFIPQHLRERLLREGCINSLRNACFHPALVNPDAGGGRAAVERLVEALESWGESRASSMLRNDYSFIRSRDLFEVAVRLINELGVEFLRRT